MFYSFFVFYFLITTITSITIVPGIIHVELLPENQVSDGVYPPSAIVHYLIQFENVPITDEVRFGVEIRGSNPSGGPRGYITMANSVTSIKEFVAQKNNRLQFKLIPNEIFAGYNWFLRPFVFFANESMISTNMMNSGASNMFTVLKQ